MDRFSRRQLLTPDTNDQNGKGPRETFDYVLWGFFSLFFSWS